MIVTRGLGLGAGSCLVAFGLATVLPAPPAAATPTAYVSAGPGGGHWWEAGRDAAIGNHSWVELLDVSRVRGRTYQFAAINAVAAGEGGGSVAPVRLYPLTWEVADHEHGGQGKAGASLPASELRIEAATRAETSQGGAIVSPTSMQYIDSIELLALLIE